MRHTSTHAAARSLYLVRHAIADERGEAWPDDTKRPLTRDGRVRMRQVVRGLRQLDVTIDVVVTSPLVRAAETAGIVVRGLSPRPELVTSASLAPEGEPRAVVQAVAALRKTGSIAVVGHEPDLGKLAAWFVGAAQPIPFKKGGVGRIDFHKWPPAPGQGTFVWLATPKILRAVGRH